MPAANKASRPKKIAAPKTQPSETVSDLHRKRRRRSILSPLRRLSAWIRSVQSSSPHRSFRRTYRRDYVRSLDLPGYIAFTVEVWRTLWGFRASFGMLIVAYALFSGLLVGLASQSTYSQLGGLLRTTGDNLFSGNVGELGKAGLLLITGISGGLNPTISQAQQILVGLMALLAWLTTVWLMRAYLAGQRPSFKDGLYNAGAPIISTALVSLLLLAQLIPIGIVVIAFSAAVATGLLSGGVEGMLFWTAAFLLTLLSLYWITSTLIALVVVTLPGMYPMQALKTAGSLVVGRRFRFLLRIVWLIVSSMVAFVVIMIPIIILDAWLKGFLPMIEWLPIVPLSLLFFSSAMVVWTASYVYLLYRRVVDSDTE